jgi:DNA recombination protein RmuC
VIQIASLRARVDQNLNDSARLMHESQQSIGERLDRAAQAVSGVQKSLGSLDEATKNVFAIGKDIAELQNILRAPKIRGGFGEFLLADLLTQVFPTKYFTLQHAFKSGETVDAVVKLTRLVPIDAKFPLENFKRMVGAAESEERQQHRRKFVADVKRHIDAIAAKYIRPDESTFDFALMYIPAENVYYETIVKEEISDGGEIAAYAFAKRVVPVSPSTFYTYLQTISLGLRGWEVEENARHILEQMESLKGDVVRFKDDFEKLGTHLTYARSNYEEAEKKLGRFEEKLTAPTLSAPRSPLESRKEESGGNGRHS